MQTQKDVPFSFADIDAEWLTGALRDQGVLKDGIVESFTHKIIGEETGFLGQVVVISPVYSTQSDNAPASIVLKIPTPLKNRTMGQTMGVYEKEIRFYRDLKPRLNVRAPAHYYSALNAYDEPEVVLQRLEGLNKLPMLLIALLSVIATFFIGLFPRRYVLMIEDVSRYRMGDQQQGCSLDDVRLALKTMAALHAQFWESNDLENLKWIAPGEFTSKIIQMIYLQAVGKYQKATNLSDRQTELIEWLKTNGIQLTEVQATCPRTLLHGDYRLDNLCFDDEASEVLLLDWQTMTTGSAGLDLAYFLSAALPIETTKTDIDELVSFYHQALVQNGVEVSRELLQWQYDIGMLSVLHRIGPILFQEHFELGTDRGPEIMQNWIDRTFAKLDHIDLDQILDAMPRAKPAAV